jgi:hypothetical protein
MWPFSASNNDVIEEKRRQRTVALADVCDAPETQHAFLKATGSFTNSHIHIDDGKPTIVFAVSYSSF